MKKKLSSILGVTLALVLVFSLMGAFLPANKAEAEAFVPNQWNVMPIPTAGGRVLVAGSTVVDFAVAGDSTTIYALTGLAANQRLVKSTNGGRTFSWINDPLAAEGGPWGVAPTIVRVAPDDPETVALVEPVGPGADRVWISKTGGATWVNLGVPTGMGATERISDLAVSPARAGTILDRDYVVCTYSTDNATLTGNWGDVYVVGTSTTWAATFSAAGAFYDFTSIALAHNWVGERAVIAIGSDNASAGNTEVGFSNGDTYLVSVNVNPVVGPVLCGPGTVSLDTATHDSPSMIIGAPGTNDGCIETSDVVLPADFDSTSVGFFKAYLGWKSTPLAGVITNADDAYRVDYNSPRKLEIRSAVAIHSVDYSGTVAGGTLFAAESDKTRATDPIGVWFTKTPTAGLPSWEFSYKSPTSTGTANVNCKVQVAADFETSNVVYGGCAGGPDTAFSRSEDSGLSFNGISIIDETIGAIWDVMPTPGGEYVFMATSDNTTNDSSLWRCPNQPAIAKWDRVHFQTTAQYPAGTSIIRISPDHEEDSTVYWFSTGAVRIQRSTSNGQIWGTRTAGAIPVDAVIESKDVVYHTSGANVYVSTNGAWSFGLPKNVGIGAISTIAMAPTYPDKPVAGNVLFGGTSAVALSTDGCATFNPMFTWPWAAGAIMQLLGDKGYADNNIVYAGSSIGGEGIYRYEVGVSTSWEQISAVGAAEEMTGLAMHCGLLYGAWDTATPYSGVERMLAPFIPVAEMPPTTTMDMPVAIMGESTVPTAGADLNRAPSSLRVCGDETDVWLYAIDTVGTDTLLGYNDTMAKLTPELTIPGKVPSNPVTGMNEEFTISWPQMSNAIQWLVDIYSDEAHTNRVQRYTVTVASPTNPKITVARDQLIGGEYWCRALALDQVPGDAIWSNWSALVNFSVEVGAPIEVPYPSPQLLGPVPGATGVSIRPGFAWGAFHGAEKYEFELSTDPGVTARGYFVEVLVGLTGDAALVTTAWQCDIDLEYATNYYWHVKALTATGETPWSTGVFTTMAEVEVPAAPPPPVTIPPTPAPITPGWIWGIIIIGAVLVIVVIVLIVVTRRPA